MQRALNAYTFGRNTNFIPIPFSVRDEKKSKNILFNVELRPTEGFVVFNLEQKHERLALSVVPEATHLGTVYHPTGATIYKVRFYSYKAKALQSSDNRGAYRTDRRAEGWTYCANNWQRNELDVSCKVFESSIDLFLLFR